MSNTITMWTTPPITTNITTRITFSPGWFHLNDQFTKEAFKRTIRLNFQTYLDAKDRENDQIAITKVELSTNQNNIIITYKDLSNQEEYSAIMIPFGITQDTYYRRDCEPAEAPRFTNGI